MFRNLNYCFNEVCFNYCAYIEIRFTYIVELISVMARPQEEKRWLYPNLKHGGIPWITCYS